MVNGINDMKSEENRILNADFDNLMLFIALIHRFGLTFSNNPNYSQMV